MKAVVTGCAGFIGSHLAAELLRQGTSVVGIDALAPNYPRWMKERNIAALGKYPGFAFVEADVVTANLLPWMEGAQLCFHLAAQPGVRDSWQDFGAYAHNNVVGTQRVLEAARCAATVRKVVCASSSSVYGGSGERPSRESDDLRPVSPYGLTKLAAEHLCRIFADQHGLQVAWLRFFTVYGPGQRPDMAFHRFIRSALRHEPVVVYGDGTQARDFTYVTDAVRAAVTTATSDATGPLNVGSGSPVSVAEVLRLLQDLLGTGIERVYDSHQPGDVTHTWADLARASTLVGYRPAVSLREGLTAQINWIRDMEKMAPVKET